jgi:c-di-GMP-binding flagellar brake protein YcgR
MAVPIFLGQGHGTPLRAETFDLSESGVFIAIEGDPLRVDDLLSVRLNFGTFAQVRCEARVVRRSSARGEYPSGYGLQFLNLDARQKQELRRHITSH